MYSDWLLLWVSGLGKTWAEKQRNLEAEEYLERQREREREKKNYSYLALPNAIFIHSPAVYFRDYISAWLILHYQTLEVD